MRTCAKMKAYIEALATEFEFDLSSPGRLALFLEKHDYLVVEVFDDQVRVTNFLEVAQCWLADPMVMFYTAYQHKDCAVWIPIEVADMYGGWRLYAEPDPRGEYLMLYDPAGQDRLAQLCEEVLVENLVNFGWRENGILVSWPPLPRSHVNPLEVAAKLIDWSRVDEEVPYES